MQIHAELLEIAREGNVGELEKRLEQLGDEALETGERPRASAGIRDEKGSTLLALAAQFDHVEMVALLVSKVKAFEIQAQEMAIASASSAQKEAATRTAMLARVWKVNVNSRDCRGWTPVAIAVFHEAKKSLRVLLDNGADPSLKNQYNKNAYFFAKDDLDAANNIVKSRAEIRQVFIDWENDHRPAAVAPVTTSPLSSVKPPQKAKKAGGKSPKKAGPGTTATTAAPTNAPKASTATKSGKPKKTSTKAPK